MRADRALSGRLVCTSCGNPYGVRQSGRNKTNNFIPFTSSNKYWLFFALFIISFILILI